MPTLNITRPNLTTPVPHPTHIPGLSPSGRGVNPATGRIGDMPGGMDYLAGLGPAPAGVNIPDAAPIISLANLAGGPRPVETPQQKIARWLSSGSPWQAAGAQRLQNQITSATPPQFGGGGTPPKPATNQPVQGPNSGGFMAPQQPQPVQGPNSGGFMAGPPVSPFDRGNPGGRVFPGVPVQGPNSGGFMAPQQTPTPQASNPFSVMNPGGRIFPQQQSLVPQQNMPFNFGPFRTGRF